MEMLAAQASHRDELVDEDVDAIAADEKLSESEKRDRLQRILNMAASNGDMDRIERILEGNARQFVDLNAPDEEGTAPLIYAGCFVSAAKSQFIRYVANVIRVTNLLLQHCLMLGRMLTSKIETSGVRLCGR
jgi:hypothetical protein